MSTLAMERDRDVVVFISGWGGPGFEWIISPIRKMSDIFFETHVLHPQGFGWGDIQGSAERLCAFSSRFLPERNVFYVGHSMGGLVAKAAQEMVDVAGLVTIGTPHKGTPVASLAPWSRSARQMMPDSSFIAANASVPSMAPMLNIACRFDELVFPHSSAVHPVADDVRWVNHTHMSAIFSKKVANIVVDYLKDIQKALYK